MGGSDEEEQKALDESKQTMHSLDDFQVQKHTMCIKTFDGSSHAEKGAV